MSLKNGGWIILVALVLLAWMLYKHLGNPMHEVGGQALADAPNASFYANTYYGSPNFPTKKLRAAIPETLFDTKA